MSRILLFLDFESYWQSSKDGYGLTQMSVVEYVRDSRFKAFGIGISFSQSKPGWITGSRIGEFCSQIANDVGWSNVTLVGHNIKFDGFILREVYGVTPGSYICTKAMSKAILGKSIKNHSLATIAEYFGLVPKGSMKTDGLQTLTPEQEQELADYCIHDVELCREIYRRFAKEFPKSQYASMDQTIRMFVEPKLVLNVPLLQQTTIQEAARRANIFTEVGIPKPEFSSNVRFPALLVSKGYEVPTKPSPRRKDEKGRPIQIPALALGDTEFLELAENGNEELKRLCKARIAAKSTLLETRTKKLSVIGATGLWPFDVEFSGADQTHRFSGGSGAGGNPQNFTRDSALREAVEVPKGFELVIGDTSQIEFRLVAYLSKDPGLIRLIESGVDFYCDYASTYYRRIITKVDDLERRFGKEALLGLGYNMGADKFKTRIKIKTGQVISRDESWEAVSLYRTRYARVPKLWEELNNFIPVMTHKEARLKPTSLPITFVHEGFILPSGLKVKFPHLRQEPSEEGRTEWVYDVWDEGNVEKRKLYGGKLLENISQALVGDFIKEVMLKMGKDVVGQVHDELLFRCKKGLGQMTAQKLRRAMTVPPSWMPEIKLGAEIYVGSNWGVK